jgi:hypothetical protein
MATNPRKARRAFWLQWVAASTLVVPATAVPVAVGMTAGERGLLGAGEYALLGSIVGTVVGATQWLVIRRHTSWRGWGHAVTWMLSMGLVGAVGLTASFAPTQTLIALGTTLPQGTVGVVLLTCGLGTLVGTIQWSVLRARLSGSGWWIVANAVAAPAGLASGELVGGLGGVLVGVAVFATMTGAVLARLVGFSVARLTPR